HPHHLPDALPISATGTAPAGAPETAAAPRAERFRGSAASCCMSSVRPRFYEQCRTPPLRCGDEVEHCEIEHYGVKVVQNNDEHREPSDCEPSERGPSKCEPSGQQLCGRDTSGREAPEPAFSRLQPQEPEPPGRAAAAEATSEGE